MIIIAHLSEKVEGYLNISSTSRKIEYLYYQIYYENYDGSRIDIIIQCGGKFNWASPCQSNEINIRSTDVVFANVRKFVEIFYLQNGWKGGAML